MNELQELKTQADVRDIVESDLGPFAMRGGDARLWKCPFHGERRGYSLVVWRDGWRCFGACQEAGDAFDWLRKYRGLSLPEAADFLRGYQAETSHRAVHVKRAERPLAKPPAREWQRSVQRIVELAERALWSDEGERPLHYLRRRGLHDETIRKARLGYIPGRPWQWRRMGTLSIPCGIAISWHIDSALWAVKVRRAGGPPKYSQISGSSASGLYNADSIAERTTALFVEGEFDALLAAQEAPETLAVITLGSAAATLNSHWLPRLLACHTVLVAYDADEAGLKGATRLLTMLHSACMLPLPFGKDVTEFVQQGETSGNG